MEPHWGEKQHVVCVPFITTSQLPDSLGWIECTFLVKSTCMVLNVHINITVIYTEMRTYILK